MGNRIGVYKVGEFITYFSKYLWDVGNHPNPSFTSSATRFLYVAACSIFAYRAYLVKKRVMCGDYLGTCRMHLKSRRRGFSLFYMEDLYE